MSLVLKGTHMAVQSKIMKKDFYICLFVAFYGFGAAFAQDEIDATNSGLDFEELINVKITVASKIEESVSDAPGVISVISKNELQLFGGTTLADILKRIPSFCGVTMYMTDRSVVAVRGDQVGTSSNHILMLINGRPIREIHEGGIKSDVLESFPVNVIERIEVIRGPGSVLYGSQAFSGVVNVVTKSAENNTVSVSGRLGERLNNDVSADIQYKFGDLGIVVAGRYADKGGWKTRYHAPADIPNVTSGLVNSFNLTIPDYGPGVYGELSYKGLRLMGSFNQWSTQYYVPLYEFLNTAEVIPGHTLGRAEWKKFFADAEYRHEFTEWYAASFNITGTNSQFETGGWPHTSRNSYEAIFEQTHFFTPVKNLNVLVGGVAGIITGLEKNAEDIPDYNEGIYNKGHVGLTGSGYLQADYRWNWCKIIGGLQINKVRFTDSLDHIDSFKPDINPRAGLIFYPLEHIDIKALYSTAYRAPSLNELYMDYSVIAGKMTRRSDPLFDSWDHEYIMKPEKVYTYDLGVNYKSDNGTFGINGFYSEMKNIIRGIVDPTRYSIPTWDNYGEVSIFGLECEGKYYATKNLIVQGSFLYQQNKDEKTRETNVTPVPNFSVKGGMAYHSDFGLTISAFNTFQESVDPKYYDKLNKSTRFFNMANIHCSYNLNRYFVFSSVKELILLFDIDNILDEEVWLPAWGEGPGYSIPVNQGRTIYGGFKVAF